MHTKEQLLAALVLSAPPMPSGYYIQIPEITELPDGVTIEYFLGYFFIHYGSRWEGGLQNKVTYSGKQYVKEDAKQFAKKIPMLDTGNYATAFPKIPELDIFVNNWFPATTGVDLDVKWKSEYANKLYKALFETTQ